LSKEEYMPLNHSDVWNQTSQLREL